MANTDEMDVAASTAEKELKELDQHVSIPMARWFEKHYMDCGHKRLGRILVSHAKETKDIKEENWC